jgi:TRAP-type C4-dicarboxylate transport system substrate-binding protein
MMSASTGKIVAASAVIFAGVVCVAGNSSAQTTLRFATTLPPTNQVIVQCIEPWVKELNQASVGEFNIQMAYGPTIANAVNVWDRVADGIVDIGWGIHGAVNLPFPKTSVVGLPLLLQEGDEAKGAAALWRLYQSGLIADEYKTVRPIMLAPTPVQGLSLRAPIKTLDEVKGLKIRTADKSASDVVAALGASAISVPAAEVYQAISQGVVSGSVANPIIVTVFKLNEVAKYHLQDISLGAAGAFIVMNSKSYDRLSDKGKSLFDTESGGKFSRSASACFAKLAADLKSETKKDPNQTFLTLEPSERKRWESVLETVKQRWLTATPDGQKVYDAFRKELGQAP